MESSIGDGSGGFLDVELIVEVAMRAREISLHFGDVGVAARPRATFVFVDFRIFVVEIGIDDMPRRERIDGEALVAQRVVSSPSRDEAAVLVGAFGLLIPTLVSFGLYLGFWISTKGGTEYQEDSGKR